MAHEFRLKDLKAVSEHVGEFALKHFAKVSYARLTVSNTEIVYTVRCSKIAKRARITVRGRIPVLPRFSRVHGPGEVGTASRATSDGSGRCGSPTGTSRR